ncbi:uncharacterized protein DSM5745_03358 [Aspergillus mulundensis]|uniref:Uncharacterized protein n=1 Tax=Aspergillus mulundensis TaxID=1810919 RepID=A0A3D8SKB4_9EURO|nr:Uncharacterized protein DSM5745_03358 [Aspergillus mulundensis]RDW86716.1 Uncharacterized protein DSM5745_03358 [Aspergillus mulundensis]
MSSDSSTTDSYILPTPTSSTTNTPPRARSTSYTDSVSSIASLPSESTSASDLETLSDDSDYSDAEAEWQESIEQLELLLTMVIVPVIGKYLGRRCAYWGWTRFMEWKYPIEFYGVGEKGSSVKAYAAL